VDREPRSHPVARADRLVHAVRAEDHVFRTGGRTRDVAAV
jgi:hypothetical protein